MCNTFKTWWRSAGLIIPTYSLILTVGSFVTVGVVLVFLWESSVLTASRQTMNKHESSQRRQLLKSHNCLVFSRKRFSSVCERWNEGDMLVMMSLPPVRLTVKVDFLSVVGVGRFRFYYTTAGGAIASSRVRWFVNPRPKARIWSWPPCCGICGVNKDYY